MKAVPLLIGAILLLGAGLAYAHPHSQDIQRRTPWNSVHQAHYQHYKGQAWPCPGSRPGALQPCIIRWCFQNEESRVRLGQTVMAGIAHWKPAVEASWMRFAPAANTPTNLCTDPGVSLSAVRILHERTIVGGRSTLGYMPFSEDFLKKHHPDGIHLLEFNTLPPQVKATKAFAPPPGQAPHEGALYFEVGTVLEVLHSTPVQGWVVGITVAGRRGIFPIDHVESTGLSLQYDAYVMAHELGHVAGLDHEHQRTDARAHFHFDCSQIHGYAEVKAAIDGKQKDLGYRNGDTIERVCEDSEMAKRYEDEIPEFAIAAWMPMDRSDVNGPQPKSVKTDFDSIMIYNSYNQNDYKRLAGKNYAFPQGAILTQIDPSAPSGRKEILGGGMKIDPATQGYDLSGVKVSEGDIARIAQLYPRDGVPGRAVAFKPEWQRAQQ